MAWWIWALIIWFGASFALVVLMAVANMNADKRNNDDMLP